MNVNLDIDIRYRNKRDIPERKTPPITFPNLLSLLQPLVVMNSMGSGLPKKNHTKQTDPSPVIFVENCPNVVRSYHEPNLLFCLAWIFFEKNGPG